MLRLRWLRLVTWERRLHLRLPVASSLHETPGDKQVTDIIIIIIIIIKIISGVQPPALCGQPSASGGHCSIPPIQVCVIVIIHSESFNTMMMIIPRDKVKHDVSGNIQLVRHGTAHQGPVGQEVSLRTRVIIIIMIYSYHVIIIIMISSSGADSPIPVDQGAGHGVAGGLSRPDQVLYAGDSAICDQNL